MPATPADSAASTSQIFLQALAAYGVPARYLEVGTDSNPYNHYTTEVWSNDYNKWVLLDVAFNNHFVRGGVPLSAVELRDAKLQNRLGEVEVVLGAVRAGHPSPFDYPQRSAELYHYIRFHLNANHVSAPNELPFERYLDMVEWLDGQTIPWELSTTPSEFPHERPTAVDTADRTLVDWAPNQVWIAARRSGVMQVTLDLEHSVLQHSHYQDPGDRRRRRGWTVGHAHWECAGLDGQDHGPRVPGPRGEPQGHHRDRFRQSKSQFRKASPRWRHRSAGRGSCTAGRP